MNENKKNSKIIFKLAMQYYLTFDYRDEEKQ